MFQATSSLFYVYMRKVASVTVFIGLKITEFFFLSSALDVFRDDSTLDIVYVGKGSWDFLKN